MILTSHEHTVKCRQVKFETRPREAPRLTRRPKALLTTSGVATFLLSRSKRDPSVFLGKIVHKGSSIVAWNSTQIFRQPFIARKMKFTKQ